MEVRPGYKQTEVGIVPNDWQVFQLSEIAETSSGTTPARAMQERYYRNGSIAWVKTMDLNNSEITSTSEHVTDVALKETCLRVYPIGTVLIAMYGGFQQIGRTGLLRIPATVNQAISAVQPNSSKLVSEYLLAILNHRVEYWKSVASSSRKDPNISSQDIRNFQLAHPSPPEQRAIAAALNDVDGLLGSLDRLIVKKRDLKQAAMRQLFTGQIRLPGFRGEWQETVLGQLGDTYGGLTGKTKADFGHGAANYITFLNIMNNVVIDTNLFEKVKIGSSEHQNMVIKGDLFFNGSSETPEEVGMCAVLLDDVSNVYLNSFCFGFRLFDKDFSNGLYLTYFFRSAEGRKLIYSLAQGATRHNLSKTALLATKFRLPSFVEQTAIAEALTDMDAELAALEVRRNKTRDLKQAMMQELLTGRIRLLDSHISHERPKLVSINTKRHNWAFNEAVVIATLVKHFGAKDYPLGRKRYTKLSYLLHRNAERKVEGYLKKAAGPYNPNTRYGGPEKIARENGYICEHKVGKYLGFVAASNIDQAEIYFKRWYGAEALQWLYQFRFKSNDDLEVLATVDMAAEELRSANKNVDVSSVKKVIRNHPEWKAKLDRAVFSDANIVDAIKQSKELGETKISNGLHA